MSDDADPIPQRMRTGLRTSVVNNSAAYGFSIMITGTFGVLTRTEGDATVAEIFLYGMLAVAGFVVLEALASSGFRRRPETYPVEVTMLGTAFDFVSVAGGFGMALAATAVFDDTLAWIVGPFAASSTYVLLSSVELAVVEPFEERWVTRNRPSAPEGPGPTES